MKQNIFLLTLEKDIEECVRKIIDLDSFELNIVNKNELMVKLYELNPQMLIIDMNSFTTLTLQMIQSVLSIEFVPVLYIYNRDISIETRETLSGNIMIPVHELDRTLPLLTRQSVSFKNRYNRLMDSYDTIDSINGQIKRFLEKYVHENQLEEFNIIKDILRFVFIENVILKNKPKDFWLIINEDETYNAWLFTLTSNREIIQKDIIPIAKEMGLSKGFIDEIYYSAQMHDVGKIYVDKSILTKPGKLTNEEYEHMKLHTIYGDRIIGDSQHLKMACEIAVNHHERFDGTGYPKGKRGEEIPLSSRIVLLADIYDALRSERSYKSSISHKKAYDIITCGDGRVEPTHFDPKVLDTFRQIHYEFEKVYKELS